MTGISEDRRPAASAHAVAVEDGKPVPRRWLAKAKARASAARARLASLRARLGAGEQPWLLLAWDIASLKAAVHVGAAGKSRIVATAESKQARFADALDEVRTLLAGQSGVSPRRVALAARTLLPGVIDLPVAPDKPRPARQMRELLQSELEPILAEFGGLWSLGALLEARGHLSPVDRERVTLEEAVRREGRRTPLRYGETALEMALIDRAGLDECLELQGHLQNLDGDVVAGWRGRFAAGRPLWLGCGVAAGNHRHWQEALAERNLCLTVCLPLAWLVSEPTSRGEDRRDGAVATICLELHREEVVAVHRQDGAVLATRSEGRLERRLRPDWLARLLSEWNSETRCSLELVCLHADDEAAAQGICDDLSLCTGYPARLRTAGETWQGVWFTLASEAASQASRLPRIVERELRDSLWKSHDFRRLAGIGVLVAALGVIEGVQQYRLYRLNATVAERSRLEREKSQTSQRESQFTAELNELAASLDASRRQLEPLVNDRERLTAIVAMRQKLPDLLLLLAEAVGTDAVLDSLRNSKVGSNATSVQVVAWSASYTGAQAFVGRIAERTHAQGYAVAQTEIVERKGRNNKLGHEVSFWLVPAGDDLESALPPAQAATGKPPANPAGGISAGSTAVRP